jgi:hypothetical protein
MKSSDLQPNTDMSDKQPFMNIRKWISLFLAIGLLGCSSEPRWTINSPQFFPVTIDYWEDHGVFLVGSYQDGTIAMLNEDGVERQSTVNMLSKTFQDRIYRLKIDKERQRLWVLGAKGITVINLPNGNVERHFWILQTPPNAVDCLPDLALDSNGTAFISNTRQATIYRISGETLSVEEVEIDGIHSVTLGHGFSSLAALDDRTLIAGNAASGRIWKIDAHTFKAIELFKDRRLVGVCGLTVAKDHYVVPAAQRVKQLRMYAATGFSGGIAEIELTIGTDALDAKITGFKSRAQVAIGIHAFRNFLLFADSQLGHHSDFGGSREANLPFRIFVFGLPFPHNPNDSCRSWRQDFTKNCGGI